MRAVTRVDELLQLAFARQDAGHIDDAIQLYEQILAQQPAHADAMHELGLLRVASGQRDDGLRLLHAAAALAPRNERFQLNLAIALRQKPEQHEQAIDQLRRAAAAALVPANAAALAILATWLREDGRLEEACDAARQALAARPDDAGTLNTLAQALQDQGKLDDAIATWRRALEVRPDYAAAHTSLLLCMNYHEGLTAQQVADAHRAFGANYQPDPLPPRPAWPGASDGRIRVGYLSPDLRQHSVAFFIWRVLAKHDRGRVRVTCYSDAKNPDAITQQLARLPERWVVTAGMTDDQAAQTILRDQNDLLIDLAGHTAGNRLPLLASRRLAPVQATYLGYPNTTGLATIDWLITDAIVDPPGTTESHYAERLVRLPGPFFVYVRPGDFPEVAPAPALSRGHVTFAVFAYWPKVRPPMMALWAEILRALPHARLILQAKALIDPPTRDAAHEFFARRALADRVTLLGWQDFPQHLRLYKDVDIILDTFPFNGHTTTCHALWMGLPVVTLSGQAHRSRMGNSVLTHLGLGELVAHDEAQYVRIAVELANDLTRVAALRAGMRQRMRASVLVDDERFARGLEAAYKDIVGQHRGGS